MKRIVLFLGALAVSTSALAQAPADLETALTPAPPQLKDGATVIKWKPDYTYDTVRKGTNTLVCFDRSGQPGQQPFAAECTSLANLPRVAQNLKFEAEPDRAKRTAALAAAEKDGSRIKPEYGSVWYHVMGMSKDNIRRHTTIAVPGATTATTGIPDNGKQGGVWIMDAGTSTAHLMIPGF
jgi:hypothetical protein